jgi:biopolymer transport protein TolR
VANGNTREGDESITGINVTPLVDVVLVLLIVLMVAASAIAQRSLPITLPTERADAATPPPTIGISLDARGHASVDGHATGDAELRAYVRRLVQASPEGSVHASLSADTASSHGDVVRVLDLLRLESVTHVAIGVLPPSSATPGH